VAADGTAGNQTSNESSISADGRFVAFTSAATNLVPGDTNGTSDIFVRDTVLDTIERASVGPTGTQGSTSYAPAISADGRYVAFTSTGAGLIPGDTFTGTSLYMHDRQTGDNSRLSVSSDGANGGLESQVPSFSGDARYVAYSSRASNLVPSDTNGTWDVFVRDRVEATTTRVSVADDTGAQGNGSSENPMISGNGRFVVFMSRASNLVAGDTNNATDVFVHDRETGETSRVSVKSGGAQGGLNQGSSGRAISFTGRYVAFASSANLTTLEVWGGGGL